MSCKKSYGQGLSMRKKTPIWELFFAAQFLWPQHFYTVLHMTNMGNFLYLNYEKGEKIK